MHQCLYVCTQINNSNNSVSGEDGENDMLYPVNTGHLWKVEFWWGGCSSLQLVTSVLFEFCIIWIIRKINNETQGDYQLCLSEDCLVIINQEI